MFWQHKFFQVLRAVHGLGDGLAFFQAGPFCSASVWSPAAVKMESKWKLIAAEACNIMPAGENLKKKKIHFYIFSLYFSCQVLILKWAEVQSNKRVRRLKKAGVKQEHVSSDSAVLIWPFAFYYHFTAGTWKTYCKTHSHRSTSWGNWWNSEFSISIHNTEAPDRADRPKK